MTEHHVFFNQRIEDAVRNEHCTDCKLHDGAAYNWVCETGSGDENSSIIVVGRMPNSDTYQKELEEVLTEVGLDIGDMYFTAALKCRNFDKNSSATDVKACRQYLDREIALIQPRWVLALGNEALLSTTGHSGIMKYRGRVIERDGYSVFPTVSQAAVRRNPGQRSAWGADLQLFAAEVYEKASKIPPPKISVIDTLPKFKKMLKLVETADLNSYDIETHGYSEFDPEGKIVCLCMTLVHGEQVRVVALPLYHPQSPFRRSWIEALHRVREAIRRARKRKTKFIAQNGKFDARWLRHYNVPATVTFDTMLAAHLLDENRLKGLKPQAASRLGVRPWAIDTKNLLTTPLRDVLKYCSLDTYYCYHIYLELRAELVTQPRLARVFKFITMAAAEMYIDVERRGVWVDREVLATNAKIAEDMRQHIDDKLMSYVPTGTPEELDELGWPHKGRRATLMPVNFRPSNFARWFLFNYLELPIIARGKEKPNGAPGDPSMAEAVMIELKGEHPVVELLLERAKWEKFCGFFTSYDEVADDNDRIHTTFKLAGTVTGRTSSGKADEEKITVRGADIRGINLQQVPRDPLARSVFGAPPGWVFVEADYSQVELVVVAFIARERTMLHLFRTGQDIHRATASWVLGIPPDRVDKNERKKAKAVNFGFVYGMGWRKFILTAKEKYGVDFTPDEAQQIRREFFRQFKGLQAWHARQRRLVHEHHRVQSPIGRIRHLPDILSPEQGVQAEAERQAINSPVQSFGSDMLLFAATRINKELKRRKLPAYIIGTVHDAALFEVREDAVAECLPIIKKIMEDVEPLRRFFGCNFDVPLRADLKVGKHWGDARELTEEEVWNYKAEITS